MKGPPRKRKSLRSFTLIELMVVILLTGLLATAVSLSMAHAARSAQMEDVLDQIAYRDALVRDYARAFARPCTLFIQLDEGKIRGEVAQNDGLTAQQPSYVLPKDFRITRVLSPNVDARIGEVAIPCSAAGRTPSYTLLVEDAKQQRKWLLFAGLTGQTQKVQVESEIEKLFSELSASRPDSD